MVLWLEVKRRWKPSLGGCISSPLGGTWKINLFG